MTKTFLDTETCGLHGMPVILQYAYNDGPINIHEFWRVPIGESLELVEKICETNVIGFNLAFDWFQLAKVYTIFRLCDPEWIPEDHIQDIARLEERGRDGPCVKPYSAFDLMLHARKTEFQSTMERNDIRLRRIPTGLAFKVAEKLEELIQFDSLLFARNKNRFAPKWVVYDLKGPDGEINPHFKDIVLKFKPSVALKALALHALKIPPAEILAYGDIEVDKKFWPAEVGYAPFADGFKAALKTMSKEQRKKYKAKKTWPDVIQTHINHWAFHKPAREYASKDVDFTRRLYAYFGSPPIGDDDSVLACSVAAVRWRGYAVDLAQIEALKAKAQTFIKETPTAPHVVKRWIGQAMDPETRRLFASTKKTVLEKMAATAEGETCPFGPCEYCNQTGMVPGDEPAKRAKAVLDARKMKKEIELYDKIIAARRFHASFKVIGALSGRMAGADKLNPQGIKRTTEVRSAFLLAFGGLDLEGGDFSGFEVVLAEASYHDPQLRKDLLTCEKCRDVQVDYIRGKKVCPKCGGNKTMKIHALFGTFVYPHLNYDQIKETEGKDPDLYTRSKSAVFALIYGGMAYTLMTRLNVPIEIAEEAYQKFVKRYPGVGKARQRIIDSFCTMRQAGGIGSKIEYTEPNEYVESLLGFRRWFTLENKIVKAIFDLASNPPEEWTKIKVKVRRRDDREQSISGAVRSALYGCAFTIQSANMRAAANHEIQSSGAGITKCVQRKVWDVQPHGIHPWLVQPCNIHDQVLCPTHPSVRERVGQAVYDTVESFRDRVPLIELDWKSAKSWGEK